MMPLEVHVPKEGEVPPFEEVPYYFPTRKGWFTNMPTLFGVGQGKMKGAPPVLTDFESAFRLNDRKFPVDLLLQAHAFFKAVFQKTHAESSLFILYHRETDTFKLWAPEQYVSHVSVNHRLGNLPAGFTTAGTIHSHCDFSAFHSGTDQHDMAGMPGLHITIGHVDREEAEFALALSLGESQYDVDYDDIIATPETPVARREDADFPTHWLSFVHTGTAPWTGTITKYAPKGKTVGKKFNPWSSEIAPSQFRPTFGGRSRIEHDWNQQAWTNEDDWDAYIDYNEFLESHEPQPAVGSKDGLVALLGGPTATDAPSDVFNYYREELSDFQYDLNIIGDQLAELGFDFDWSIAWDPTEAQERMLQDDAPTP